MLCPKSRIGVSAPWLRAVVASTSSQVSSEVRLSLDSRADGLETKWSVAAWRAASPEIRKSLSPETWGSLSLETWKSLPEEVWRSLPVDAWQHVPVEVWGCIPCDVWEMLDAIQLPAEAAWNGRDSVVETPACRLVLLNRSYSSGEERLRWLDAKRDAASGAYLDLIELEKLRPRLKEIGKLCKLIKQKARRVESLKEVSSRRQGRVEFEPEGGERQEVEQFDAQLIDLCRSRVRREEASVEGLRFDSKDAGAMLRRLEQKLVALGRLPRRRNRFSWRRLWRRKVSPREGFLKLVRELIRRDCEAAVASYEIEAAVYATDLSDQGAAKYNRVQWCIALAKAIAQPGKDHLNKAAEVFAKRQCWLGFDWVSSTVPSRLPSGAKKRAPIPRAFHTIGKSENIAELLNKKCKDEDDEMRISSVRLGRARSGRHIRCRPPLSYRHAVQLSDSKIAKHNSDEPATEEPATEETFTRTEEAATQAEKTATNTEKA
ncbi:hypothetical protein GNI_134540 [Gregarina niphandrodes]|uniref:Uncharacterized protein n=1 Tax=Gregarina niphandrodes TaxID=110365 RepID=A0A023B189_GRENI|nr:hypothetical protein GNI_134540 [Gregarina niphandrodes]EZG46178.1 hypothetical protein GNI_134540 [Gregarina niphandrodes]|eukprot:XP_011132339.1 hypothetical protein GNI_134540 [Gregarina niphandrodes]